MKCAYCNTETVGIPLCGNCEEKGIRLPASPCSLLDCVCGGSPEVDWDSCMDWGGRSWQTVSAICKECMRSTAISIDADNDQEREAATQLVEPHWNAFITANVEVHTSATGGAASTQVEGCSGQPESDSERVADCGATPCSISSFLDGREDS